MVDVETTANDLQCAVCIDEYSSLLLAEASRQDDVIVDFYDLQEMRDEWHEDVEQLESPSEFAERKLRDVANKYGLQYVTD